MLTIRFPPDDPCYLPFLNTRETRACPAEAMPGARLEASSHRIQNVSRASESFNVKAGLGYTISVSSDTRE